MNNDTKKKIFIALGVGVAVIAGFIIYGEVEDRRKIKQAAKKAEQEQARKRQQHQKKMSRLIKESTMINILKKARKDNFKLLKKIASMATQIALQMKSTRIQPTVVKRVLESSESPFKVQDQFTKVYEEACRHFHVTHQNFAESLDYYLEQKDVEIKALVEEIQRDYQSSLSGKIPEVKVSIPPALTQEKILEVYNRLALKKHLIQIDTFRKTRGKTQKELDSNQQLRKSISNPDQQQLKILEGEGLGSYDFDPQVLYAAALAHYKGNPQARSEILKIDSHYAKSKNIQIVVLNRYKGKIATNKITESQLNDLQDELIYADSIQNMN